MIRVPLQVRYNDYDAAGHVNNAVYFSYFEVARAEAWRRLDRGEEPGFILASASATYRSPAMVGDRLVVELVTGEVRTKAWTWRYRVLEERDGRLVAEGETTQVLYDYAARRTTEIPPELREKLASL
jgi:acyl-CoA thioester hydrolase